MNELNIAAFGNGCSRGRSRYASVVCIAVFVVGDVCRSGFVFCETFTSSMEVLLEKPLYCYDVYSAIVGPLVWESAL